MIKGFKINGNVEKYDYNSLENLPDISGGSTNEEWVELLNTTLAEDVAYVDIVAPDGKKFKRLHILIATGGAGLSAASKVLIKGGINGFCGGNGDCLTITPNTLNTYAYPTFIIEKGALFPIALASQGTINGQNSTAVYMGGVYQNHSQNTDARYVNNGAWKNIRIQPQTADVVFKTGVQIYAWGVYE